MYDKIQGWLQMMEVYLSCQVYIFRGRSVKASQMFGERSAS